jgi:menaquinone-dependent protoporphyrinogen oxidase
MSIAIIYATKYGATEKVALLIAKKLQSASAEVFNLETNKQIDLQQFDTIVLGTAVYAGAPRKAMKDFCEVNTDILAEKRLGLFVCGMEQQEENQREELAKAYPQSLHDKAIAEEFLGGEFQFDKMNFIEKMIIKKIAKTDKNQSDFKDDRITALAEKMGE